MKAIIVGKGPTAIKIKKEEYPDTILIGINQAINMIDKPDYLVINDWESVSGIDDCHFKDIKNIIIPVNLFKRDSSRPTYLSFIEYIGDKFSGNYIIHKGNIPIGNCITRHHIKYRISCDSSLLICDTDERPVTTACIGTLYCLKFLNVTHIDYYGVAVLDKLTSEIKDVKTNNITKVTHTYNNDFLKKSRASLEKKCDKYNCTYAFN